MYENIGGKIKKLAKGLFIIAAIGSVITGIALLTADEDLVLFGLLTMIGGPIVSWISSWTLYAFGEIAEDIHEMRNNACPQNESSQETNHIANKNSDSELLAYYISKDGAKIGPYNMKDLSKMVAEGLLSPYTYVWKKGMSKWVVAKEADDLSGLFASLSSANE